MSERKIGKKLKLTMSRLQGRMGEISFDVGQTIAGKPVNRTGIGSDYERGGKYFEVKTGGAKLTKRQEQKRKKVGEKNYEVVRIGLKKY